MARATRKAGFEVHVATHVNDGADAMQLLWVISPPGLEKFFADIGRPRHAGEPAPVPFARPMENFCLPDADKIVAAAKSTLQQ